MSLFGSINVAMPFLLDLARVPADTFQLFLASGVLNSRFGTLAGASHMVVLALVGSYALRGRLRLSAASVLRYALTTALLTAATLGALALTLRALGGGSYEAGRVASGLGLLRPASEHSTLLAELPAEPLHAPGTSLLASVRARGRIRVGYFAANTPTATSTATATSSASTSRWRTSSRSSWVSRSSSPRCRGRASSRCWRPAASTS